MEQIRREILNMKLFRHPHITKLWLDLSQHNSKRRQYGMGFQWKGVKQEALQGAKFI